jgi:hypothetical protein
VFPERIDGDLAIPLAFAGAGDLEGVRGLAELRFEVRVSTDGRRAFGLEGGLFLGAEDAISSMGGGSSVT